MRYAFYSHGGSQNHGCEAIVRTLSALIKNKDKNAKIKLYSFNVNEDNFGNLPNVDEFEEFRYYKAPKNVFLKDKLKIALYSKKSQKQADEYYYSLFCKNPTLAENDVYISVGGDNYCYGDGHIPAAMNKELRRLGKKTVLWGCSVGEDDLTADKIEDLKGFDLIVARETLTYNTLIKNSVDKNTVLYPDSAFTLDIDCGMENEIEVRPNTLGFNISSLINDYTDSDKNETDSIFYEFLSHVLKSTDMNIMLIPHVTRDGASDYSVLKELYIKLNSDRVSLVGDSYTASQYKSVISRCDMFIGARTHATIAAYSTCVPTLVLGYSVKSKGIAKDIFGTDEGLVLPVQEIKSAEQLTEYFDSFAEHKAEYKKRLEEFIPGYIDKAKASIDELFKIK